MTQCGGPIDVPILLMRTLRHRELKESAQGPISGVFTHVQSQAQGGIRDETKSRGADSPTLFCASQDLPGHLLVTDEREVPPDGAIHSLPTLNK